MNLLKCFGLAIAVSTAPFLLFGAEADRITVTLDPSPPFENVLISFSGMESPDGWGWSGTKDEWRDVGMSFRCPEDSRIERITLSIQKIPVDFLGKSRFLLRIYKTPQMGVTPESGELVYSGRGELELVRGDGGAYITLTLGADLPVDSGEVYTFLLSWEDEAPFHLVVFNNNTGYTDGQVWYRNGRGGGELEHLSRQTDQPGLVFYVQKSPRQNQPR